MPKLSRDAWVMLSLLVILLLIALIAGHQQDKRNAGGFDPRRTSYSTAPAGLRGLYDTLDELGYSVNRHIDDLTVQPDDGILFLIAPDTPVSDDEMRALHGWVERGNTLVMVSTSDYAIVEDEHPKAHRSTSAVPSFLTPDVNSFNVAGSNRISDEESTLGDALSCSSGYG